MVTLQPVMHCMRKGACFAMSCEGLCSVREAAVSAKNTGSNRPPQEVSLTSKSAREHVLYARTKEYFEAIKGQKNVGGVEKLVAECQGIATPRRVSRTQTARAPRKSTQLSIS